MDSEKRLSLIQGICERLKESPRPKLRVKGQRKLITNHRARVRRIPKECLDKIPMDAQIVGEDENRYFIYH